MMRLCQCGTLWLLAGALASAGDQPKPFKSTPDELKILELTNLERKQKDLPALKLSPALSKVARAHSENMARQEKMEHKLDDKDAFDRLRGAGYKYGRAGENIAAIGEGATLPMLMKAWMDSKGHRENILRDEFTEIGVGIAQGKDGQRYYTQVFARPKK